MYYCSYIDAAHKSAWEKLAQNHPAGGFHQSFGWAKFKQSVNWDSYKIGLFENNTSKLVGGAIVLEFTFPNGINFLYLPEGPLLDYNNEDNLFWQWRALETAIHSIASLTKDAKTTHIRIEPRIEKCPKWFLSQFIKAPLNLQPKHTQIIDLTNSKAKLLEQMKPKGRYNINLAERKGVSIQRIKHPTPKHIDAFYKLYEETFNRNKFDGKDKQFFLNYLSSCKEFSEMYFAKIDNDIAATSIVVNFGKRVTYLYGASSRAHKEYMAPYLMHWEIMKTAKSEKFKEYDLWGVCRSDKDKDHDWHGLTQFKKKFGGKQLDWIGSFDYVLQKDLYEKFVEEFEKE